MTLTMDLTVTHQLMLVMRSKRQLTVILEIQILITTPIRKALKRHATAEKMIGQTVPSEVTALSVALSTRQQLKG